MEQTQTPIPAPSPSPTTPPSTPQPPESQQPPPPSPTPPTQTTAAATTATTSSSAALPPPTPSSLPPTTAATSPLPALPSHSQNRHPPTPTPTTTPTPSSTPQPSQTSSQTRPSFSRPWQQPQPPSPFSHFSLPPPPLHLPPYSANSTTSATNSSSPAIPVPPPARDGMAIGVPAHHPGTPSPPSTSFSSLNSPSFGQPFGSLGRSLTDSGATSSSSQVRSTVGGMQGIGMIGSMGSSSAMRPPTGVPSNQLRPVQSSARPQSIPSIQSPATQNFQGHGMLRVSSVGSPGSPSPSTSQSLQPQNQPWLSSGSQMRPPLPQTSLRPQVSPQSLPQRSHFPQHHHHSMTTASQQQQASSAQQSPQPSTSGHQEHSGQQFPQSRIQQSLPAPQQSARNQSLGTQRPPHSTIPSTTVQSGLPNRIASAEPEESCNRILSKRSIQELVTQVDPSEKLDPEVENILVDIAEDFVDSITTFGCSLAKHRKSSILEAKDILLHLERNWNMTLPGFSGDEIKMYKKPFTSDIHKERLAVIKKSILAGETMNSKSLAGQAGGNPKAHLAKGATSIPGSPMTKGREAA